MNYITVVLGKLISITLLSLALNNLACGQDRFLGTDSIKTADKAAPKSTFHIIGSGPVLASGLPVFIDGREVTNQPLPDPGSIKSLQVIRRGDPRLIAYGSKGINGVLLMETTVDTIKVGQPLRKK